MSDDQVDDSPIDLSALEPTLVAPVMRRIHALPAGDRIRIGPLWGLWSMSRGLSAAGALTVVLILALTRPWQSRPPRTPATVAESIGVPPEFRNLLTRQGGAR